MRLPFDLRMYSQASRQRTSSAGIRLGLVMLALLAGCGGGAENSALREEPQAALNNIVVAGAFLFVTAVVFGLVG